jgi:prevent-host-death family protein
MEAINLADAKAQLSALVDRVQGGEAIEILRRGRPVAHLTAASTPRKKIDLGMLRALTAGMEQGAPGTVREMRDEDRY